MKKWIIIAVVLLVVALFAVILIFGSRFLSLYASMDSDREAAPPSSEVESYMSAHWPQYESIYDSSTQTLQNVLYAYFRLGDVRNKISHADASAMVERRLIVSESDVSSAMLLMQERLLVILEKALPWRYVLCLLTGILIRFIGRKKH